MGKITSAIIFEVVPLLSKHKNVTESRQGFDDQCLGFIASRLRQAAFVGGEVIFERGERGDEMYLIVEGAVVLHSSQRPPAPADKSDRSTQQQTQSHGGTDRSTQQQAHSQGGRMLSLKVGAVDLAAGERIAGKGDVFGEGVLFPEALGPLRLESAKTLSFVSVFVLTAASMREIEAEYPAVRSVLRCLRRLCS